MFFRAAGTATLGALAFWDVLPSLRIQVKQLDQLLNIIVDGFFFSLLGLGDDELVKCDKGGKCHSSSATHRYIQHGSSVGNQVYISESLWL